MVDNIWTEFARSYDAICSQLNCYRRMVAKIRRDTEGRKYVIDAGCGTGLVSQPLVERGHTVVGFDNNPGMLGLALAKHERAPEEAKRRWKVLEGDVRTFPAPVPGEADAVVLNNVLFYVREPEAVLREARSHLKPGGVLIATGPRRRPDLKKVMVNSIEEWKAEGRWDEALQAATAGTWASRARSPPTATTTTARTTTSAWRSSPKRRGKPAPGRGAGPHFTGRCPRCARR
jgi:SAM-dependent methyltransferase